MEGERCWGFASVEVRRARRDPSAAGCAFERRLGPIGRGIQMRRSGAGQGSARKRLRTSTSDGRPCEARPRWRPLVARGGLARRGAARQGPHPVVPPFPWARPRDGRLGAVEFDGFEGLFVPSSSADSGGDDTTAREGARRPIPPWIQRRNPEGSPLAESPPHPLRVARPRAVRRPGLGASPAEDSSGRAAPPHCVAPDGTAAWAGRHRPRGAQREKRPPLRVKWRAPRLLAAEGSEPRRSSLRPLARPARGSGGGSA